MAQREDLLSRSGGALRAAKEPAVEAKTAAAPVKGITHVTPQRVV